MSRMLQQRMSTAMRAGTAVVGALIACLAIAAGARYAFLQIFGQFTFYDDEGYVMTSVRTFLDGQPLYDRTFTQYGPFYYAFMGAIYSVARIPIGHDATRIITIVVWVGTASLLGYFVFRVTRSFGVALAVYLQTVLHSLAHIGEPGHPQGLVVLLLAAMLVSATWRQPGAASIAMGVLTACVLMTKINVGLFAAAAAGISLVALASPARVWRGALYLMTLGFSVLPFVLMRPNLSTWAWTLGVLSACTIAAASVAVWRVRIVDFTVKPVWQFAAAMAATVTLVTVWTLAMGTSLRALGTAMILSPFRFGSLYATAWVLPPEAIRYGAESLAVALVAACLPRSPLLVYAGAVARIAFAVLVVSAAPQGWQPVVLVAPMAWVLLLPFGAARSSWIDLLPRVFLCLLAAGQLLVAYPVAGSQQAWATILLLPAAGVALADGVMLLWPLRVAWVRGVAEVALVAVVLYVFVPTYRADALEQRYRDYAPLNLPHSRLIHLPADQRRTYEETVSAIRAGCDTFIGLPGMGSFHFWAEKPPLTGFNATAWMTLFDDRTQRRIVYALSRHRSACVIYHPWLVQAWVAGRPIQDRPLVKYIGDEFHLVRTIGDYQLLMRNDRD